MSAPPAVSQNENAENKSKVGAFVRHQFFRDHKASASAPAAVLVETRHKDSVAAAEYSHSRASELAVKIEAKLAAEKVDKDKQPLIDDSTCTSSQSQCTDRVDVGPVNNDRATALPTEGFSKFFLGDGSAPAHQKTLTALTLLGIMFCNSIGGGYGLENSVGSGGALITTLGVIFLPFIWAVPVAFVVAELSTSVPTNGGFLMWINVSMPAPVYFFAVINTLLLMFIDNAVYPVLFADYLCQSIECSDSLHTGMKIVALFVTFILNIVGVQAVGLATIFITFISITPFATMFVVHMAKTGGYINWDNMKSVPPDIDWVTLTSTLAWNVAGFEQAGCVAEDVKNPQKSFTRAIIPLIGLVWLSYIPPVVAGVSRSHNPEDWSVWETGFFATVASDIGGQPLKIFTVVGSLFSAFGLLLSCLCLSSRTLAGTGEAMAFPRPISNVLFKHNKRFATPHWSIIINTIFTGICAVSLDFSSLVAIDQALYGIRILLIFMACIKLRYAYPTLDRPFKIPLSADKLVLALTPAMLFSMGLIILCAMVDIPTACTFAGVLVGSSGISYLYCRYYRKHGFDGRIIPVLSVDGLPTSMSEAGIGMFSVTDSERGDKAAALGIPSTRSAGMNESAIEDGTDCMPATKAALASPTYGGTEDRD